MNIIKKIKIIVHIIRLERDIKILKKENKKLKARQEKLESENENSRLERLELKRRKNNG